jgi:hypothetical protein
MHQLRPNIDGKYTVTYSQRNKKPKTNSSTIVVEGAIEILNHKLHTYLKKKYGSELIANYRPAQVKLGSLKPKQVELYPSFTINDLSLKCD